MGFVGRNHKEIPVICREIQMLPLWVVGMHPLHVSFNSWRFGNKRLKCIPFFRRSVLLRYDWVGNLARVVVPKPNLKMALS